MSPMTVGFIGTGWIGRHRMGAMLATGLVEAAAICEPDPEMAAEALKLAPGAKLVSSLDEMLELQPGGVVIATPSAFHAAQSIHALEAGAAVFCQKPLGRNVAEVEAVIGAARTAGKLLGVDFSYRHTAAMRAVREQIRSGALGSVYAADLVFHNAYGPDKPWFYDPALSGGGCLIDLGIHLVDLALWALGFPEVTGVHSRLFAQGRPACVGQVEDHAVASLELAGGAVVRIACSWNLAAGQDAVIAAEFYGSEATAVLRNVGGSFYDFTAERFHGTTRKTLVEPPDPWGGRAGVEWARSLKSGTGFEGSTEGLIASAATIDRLYATGGSSRSSPKANISHGDSYGGKRRTAII